MARISPRTIGIIAHYFTQALIKTVRIKIGRHASVDANKPTVYAFWHGTHFVPVMCVSRVLAANKAVGLVSASRDGEIFATWMAKLGYEVIRGSSSRRAVSGLMKLIQAVKKGYSVGIALDGPRGPMHEAKDGACFISARTGVPIQPIGAVYVHKHTFQKSWDRFQLPLPFGKAALYLGEPIYVSKDDEPSIVNERLKKAIAHCEEQAALLLK